MKLPDTYSVVIPAFNAEATIVDALQSVLAQTIPAAQIIVVDDGSTDRTAELVARQPGPIRLIRQANAGPGAASNRGLLASDSEYIAMLDADDLWLPDKAERQLALLHARPDLAGVFCRGRHFHPPARPGPTGQVQEIWGRTAMMARLDRVRAVGAVFDPPGQRGDMVDWIARAREAGLTFAMMDDILVFRRIHPGSLSHGRRHAADVGYLHVIKRALDRRRAAGDNLT
jgi:glycosyltransferase involved in cell wall biosynthesis